MEVIIHFRLVFSQPLENTNRTLPMSLFKDANGREWRITITGYEMRELELQKMPIASVEDIGEVIDSPGKLVEVLHLICQDEIEERKLTRKDFLRGFSGDCLSEARDAFIEAYTNFIPSKQGQVMKALYQNALETEAKSIDLTLKGIDEAATKEVETLANDSGQSSTESPGSSESAIP